MNGSAWIFNLYVYEEFRKQGNATDILKKCISVIRKKGYMGEIKIQAEPQENSIPIAKLIKFYKGMGLKIVS